MNLLEETINELREKNKTEKDVEWCGSRKFGWFSFDDFKEIADIEYDESFGAPQIAEDLVIVGKDWWLERCEYDGSEWWEFKSKQNKPKKYNKPVALSVEQASDKDFDVSCGWEELEKLNNCEKNN